MVNHNLIRFDWAIKRLLRNKANFVVLEGFLSVLLNENIKIKKILESEGNKTDESDKFNRVDILAENSKNELIIIEVQNTRELHYFQRMLYGVSKAITEYIHEGEQYSEIRNFILSTSFISILDREKITFITAIPISKDYTPVIFYTFLRNSRILLSEKKQAIFFRNIIFYV